MEDGFEDLEKEVLCLRELLSHLKIEETSLLKGLPTLPSEEEQSKLQRERLILQKKRKALFLEKSPFKELPEVITFLEQISSLKEKIADQRKINLELKKRGGYPTPQREKQPKPKKKPLLLEEN